MVVSQLPRGTSLDLVKDLELCFIIKVVTKKGKKPIYEWNIFLYIYVDNAYNTNKLGGKSNNLNGVKKKMKMVACEGVLRENVLKSETMVIQNYFKVGAFST